MTKQSSSAADKPVQKIESEKNPATSTVSQNWQQSWTEAAQKEAQAKRDFMMEALARYQQLHPEDDGT